MPPLIILIAVITILSASSHIHFSPLPSLHPPITAGHHTEFPLHHTMHVNNSSISTFNSRTPTIHSFCLHAPYITPSRELTSVTLVFSLTFDFLYPPSYPTVPRYIDDDQLHLTNIPSNIFRWCPHNSVEHSITHHSNISTFTAQTSAPPLHLCTTPLLNSIPSPIDRIS